MAGLYRAAEQGNVHAARLVFELVGIHRLQAAQRLFNEDVYVEHLENIGDGINASPLEQVVTALRQACDPYSEQLIWLMEKAQGALFDWADADDRIEVSDFAQVCLDDLYVSTGDQINVSAYYVLTRQ